VLGEVLWNVEQRNDFFGYGVPSPEAAYELGRHYRTASLAICDRWFNFLIREDLATRLSAPDLRIGR
jgi:hypothetical protein